MKNYILAIATLMGTIIGVGIFAMPYIISKSGILPLLVYMPIMAVIQYYLHLLYAEIVLSNNHNHRLPGYVGKYFGLKGKRWTLLISLFADYGVLITYIIIGGLFFHQLLSPVFGGGQLFYTTLLFLIEAVIVWYGLKALAEAEFIMTAVLVVIMGLIIWRGFFLVEYANFDLVNLKNIFLPYGPIFFAIGGSAAIPEICRLLDDNKKKIKSAIAWGTFCSAALIMMFVLVMVGITGANTSPDALSGLGQILGERTTIITLIFGLLVVATSMISIALSSKEILVWDLGLDKKTSWALTCFLPFWFYLIGVQNLTKTVSLTGAVSGGILGIVVILLVLKIKIRCERESDIKCIMNKAIAYGLSVLFVLGFIYEVWNVFFNKI